MSTDALMDYREDDYLMLSGLQHFAFCRRQWALIHIENQWAENYRTMDGNLMHKNAHDRDSAETRGKRIVTRGMRVFSASLGVSGACDIVEFRRSETGITLNGRYGRWQPYPVEYKRGKSGTTEGNALQLCGQAMCLEEMLCCKIPVGALYYGETRHREQVEFTKELRQIVQTYLSEMHNYYDRGYTPKVKPTKACNSCSLKGLCLPKLMRRRKVSDYLKYILEEET